MLLSLLALAGGAAGEALVIGDTTHDLGLARSASVSAVAVTYGAHPADGLAALAPLAIVHSIGELRSWLAMNA